MFDNDAIYLRYTGNSDELKNDEIVQYCGSYGTLNLERNNGQFLSEISRSFAINAVWNRVQQSVTTLMKQAC